MFTKEKTVKTLVSDIYSVLSDGVELTDAQAQEFGRRMATMMKNRLSVPTSDTEHKLRMSNVGGKCDRKLWYTVNQPGTAENLAPNTKLKFLYGDMVEVLVLFLAEVAGHKVEGAGDKLELAEVPGHRDCVIDGVLIDVKSASGFGFSKFRSHKLEYEDPFGYLSQLSNYLAASQDDDKVQVKGEAGFLAVDKEQGHICLDMYQFKELDKVPEKLEAKKKMVSSDLPPPRAFGDQAYSGVSGNRKLGVECSYCVYKKECWPALRTFLYSTGPVFLTEVHKTPDVPEVVNGKVKDKF